MIKRHILIKMSSAAFCGSQDVEDGRKTRKVCSRAEVQQFVKSEFI